MNLETYYTELSNQIFRLNTEMIGLRYRMEIGVKSEARKVIDFNIIDEKGCHRTIIGLNVEGLNITFYAMAKEECLTTKRQIELHKEIMRYISDFQVNRVNFPDSLDDKYGQSSNLSIPILTKYCFYFTPEEYFRQTREGFRFLFNNAAR